MNVAICFFGLSRSLPYTVDSLKKNLFDVLTKNNIQYDIFVHTYTLATLTNKRSGEQNVPIRSDEFHLLGQLKEFLKTEQADFDASIDFEHYKQFKDPWGDQWSSMKNLLRQLHSLYRVTELWNNADKKYQVVFYVRPDLLMFSTLDISNVLSLANESSKVLFTPQFHQYGGLNDRFAYGTPEAMKWYGNRYLAAHEYAKNNSLHSETFLKYIMSVDNVKLNYTNIKFGRVRANGVLWEQYLRGKIVNIKKTLQRTLEE